MMYIMYTCIERVSQKDPYVLLMIMKTPQWNINADDENIKTYGRISKLDQFYIEPIRKLNTDPTLCYPQPAHI